MPLDEPAPVHEHLTPLWELWNALHGSRDVGMSGAGSLRMSEILAALDLYGISPAGRWPWTRIILALDAEYLRLSMRAREEAPSSGSPRAVAAGEPAERGRRAREAGA